MKKVLLGILTLGLAFLAAPAFAATTADVNISATVVSSCSITALPVAFGNYDALSATPKDATGSVDVTCSVGSLPKIWLGPGLNELGGPSAAAPVRRMQKGATGNYLGYQLYQDALRATVWGGTDGSSPAAIPAVGITAVTSTIYGRVPVNQTSTTGDYTDTVVATVNF
ncbi:MAG TPA: spore coat U domain-containing protein [Thermoanaerobaculia bacterium]|jgi:spore coat protein U-like protein